MRVAETLTRIARWVFWAAAVLLIGYLAWTAATQDPQRRPLPDWLGDFGQPDSWRTVGIVVAVLAVACILSYRTVGGARRPGASIAIVLVLAGTALVLGLSSYWGCVRDDGTRFFRPLIWSAALLTGETKPVDLPRDPNQDLWNCPPPAPIALDVAQLSAFGALSIGTVLLAGALFQSQLDRLRANNLPNPINAIVDIDDDAQSMVSTIKKALSPGGVLVLLTDMPDRSCVKEARLHGARIIVVDFSRPETYCALRFWRRLRKLYLLSADSSANLARLEVISTRTAAPKDKRLALVVRIDDPWQAEAWRAEKFGGADKQWAADAFGKYEVTAQRLLDDILAPAMNVKRVIVCGTSELTLALCADLAQRQLERTLFTPLDAPRLPALMLVGANAEEYRQDHEDHQKQFGIATPQPRIEVVNEVPSVRTLMSMIKVDDAAKTAVIFVNPDPIAGSSIDSTTATRLAARFPAMPVYTWDPEARVDEGLRPVVGQLRTYRLGLDQAQDRWERAAMLIHSAYARTVTNPTKATLPWDQLDEFFKDSNRRQVTNALRIVEEPGGHTWNTWSSPSVDPLPNLSGKEPLEQLALLGFERDAALAMAREEHEDWSLAYRKAKWQHAEQTDHDRRRHKGLVDWTVVENNPELLKKSLTSLAGTLAQLRGLGYRSRPVWEKFQRTGTVVGKKRDEAWTWKTESGEELRGVAGDWEVRDVNGGDSWSVRDDIFRDTYEHINVDEWRRRGTVYARRADPGEKIESLEGTQHAANGDWVVRGERGELWVVPADKFSKRYARIEIAAAATPQPSGTGRSSQSLT